MNIAIDRPCFYRLAFLTAAVSSIALLIGILAAGPAFAAGPAWQVESYGSTRVAPGDQLTFQVSAKNIGDTETDGTGALDITLPPGLTGVSALSSFGFPLFSWNCTDPAGASSVHCDLNASVPSGAESEKIILTLEADPSAAGSMTTTFEASGGGASGSHTVQRSTAISAVPDFGLEVFDAATTNPDGTAFTEAGGHPYAASTTFELNRVTGMGGIRLSDGGQIKTAVADLSPGFIGNATAAGECPLEAFLDAGTRRCPPGSQVGKVSVKIGFGRSALINGDAPAGGPPFVPLRQLPAASGTVARFGFSVVGVPVLLDATLVSEGGYHIRVTSKDTSQGLVILGASVTLWGTPADPSHDVERLCPANEIGPPIFGCSTQEATVPFITEPTACPPEGEGLITTFRANSWSDRDHFDESFVELHEPPGYTFENPIPPSDWGPPQGPTDCERVPFDPEIEALPTTDQAETASGLRFKLEIPDLGILNPDGISQAHVKKAVVTLPEGVTLNPSQAEGLGACTRAQYESTELSAFPTPGKGCPATSKIGTVQVKTPLLAETLDGDVYVAQPDDPRTPAPGAENPSDSLIALYIVVENVERGILVKLPGKVEPDRQTGRIVATFDDLPQTPFSSFDFKFREGGRAPLATPSACGTYTTEAEFVPWSAADPDNPKPSEIAHTTSQFEVTKGVGGGPCPPAGIPLFKPGFSAGSLNNHAGSHTDFNMRLTRKDGEQNMTRFSAVLPPGVLGKLAGIGKCPDTAIALAKAKTGLEELASPSCPASSEIGRSLVGAGVGSVLTYVPGKIYLGGPVNGKPLSVIAITPAVAGPFDVGTVVVREALTLNPKTAEVEVDGAASDPIPHILEGIPAKLRDLRVYVDRPEFIINPTSCDESSTNATLFGSYLDVIDPSDDKPVALSDRFQAANCAALAFKPKLGLTLKGGTKRGGHPGLKALYKPRKGDANVKGLVVRLPRSAFLDQAHIRTICTRVQFAADNCPKGAQYGYIKAWTPLLEEPLQGPVWLRSSNHKLPDLVFDLHGLVDVEVATRIDSARGGIRATVEDAPDAPLSKVELRMQGAKKGLIVNSRNLCDAISRANVQFAGHNGKGAKANPVMRAQCGKVRKGKAKKR